jgi:MIP family channel proteins
VTLPRALAAEALGTFFLVLIGPGAAAVNTWSHGALGVTGIALAFAFVITGCIVAFGPASGAHINPAVTMALAAGGRFRAAHVLPYAAAQCAGAMVAGGVIRLAVGDAVRGATTVPAIPLSATFLLELLFSFILMMVIFEVAGRRAVTAAPAVGLTVGFCALMGGPLTGASMNPARSLGPAVASGVWTAHWLYWAAPIAGMLAATAVNRWLRGRT